MKLRGLVQGITQTGLAFMEGREKGILPLDKEVVINEFGFLNGDEGEYAVFTLKGVDKEFYYGSSVVTDVLKQVEEVLNGDGESQTEFLEHGLPVQFTQRMSKAKRKYTAIKLYP